MQLRTLLRALVGLLVISGSSLLAGTAKFDDPPVPIKAVAPVYPAAMEREGISGLVMVTVVVDENGEVVEQSITKSSREEFEQPALAAVAKWKFKPAQKDGAAVKVQITVPIRFASGA